jgi:hypothetical protein
MPMVLYSFNLVEVCKKDINTAYIFFVKSKEKNTSFIIIYSARGQSNNLLFDAVTTYLSNFAFFSICCK